MNREQVEILGNYIAACCPQQRFEKLTLDAWAGKLHNVSAADAMEAAERLTDRQPFVSIAELKQEIRAIRRDVIEHAGAVPLPGSNPDHVDQYVGELRARIKELADWPKKIPDSYAIEAPRPTRPYVGKPDQGGEGDPHPSMDDTRRHLRLVGDARRAQAPAEDREYVHARAVLGTVTDPADVAAVMAAAHAVLGGGATARDLVVQAATLVTETDRQAAL